MKKLKKIPIFKNEDEEREFWDTHDSTEYVDWSKAKNVIFPNLKPTARSISIRIPEYIINQVKVEANKLDIPYQALMKQYIAQGVKKSNQ
jgi:predicted DNA binding CopG/RHH family protein